MGSAAGARRSDPVPRQRCRQRGDRRADPGDGTGLGLRLCQLAQYRLEADAALAGECGRVVFRAVVVVASDKADADLFAAKQRTLAHCRRMLAVDELALPAAVGRAICADVVEVRVAAADPPLMQHHDTVGATADSIKHIDAK